MCRPETTKDVAIEAKAVKLDAKGLAEEDKWLEKFDFPAFAEEIKVLGKKSSFFKNQFI